jgi:hypothetical protein
MRPLLKLLEASQGQLKLLQNSSNVPVASIGLKKQQAKENTNPLLERLTTTSVKEVDYGKVSEMIQSEVTQAVLKINRLP